MNFYTRFPILRVLGVIILSLVLMPVSAQELPPETVLNLAWSHDGQRIATAQRGGTAFIWDISRREAVSNLNGHGYPVTAVAWRSDDQQLITTSDDGVIVWDTETGEQIQRLPQGSALSAIWSEDNQQIMISTIFGLRVLDAQTGEIVADYTTVEAGVGTIGELAWDSQYRRLTAGGAVGLYIFSGDKLENIVSYFNEFTEDELDSEESGNRIGFITIAWHPSDQMIAGGENGMVRVVNPDTGDILMTLNAHPNAGLPPIRGVERTEFRRFLQGRIVRDVAFSPDGSQLYTLTGDGTLRVWDMLTGEMVAEELLGQMVAGVDWSPYMGRLAYTVRPEETEDGGFTLSAESLTQINIVVPFASQERLEQVAAACIADSPDPESASRLLADVSPAALMEQVRALSENIIPPACAADLQAVAEALGS